MAEENPDPTIREILVRLAKVETDVSWIKDTYIYIKKSIDRLDTRLWWVLGSVVALGILAILVALK
jgi:hypothetical protein